MILLPFFIKMVSKRSCINLRLITNVFEQDRHKIVRNALINAHNKVIDNRV